MDHGWKKGIHLLWWIKFEPRTVTWRLLNVDETQDFYLFYYYSIFCRENFRRVYFRFLKISFVRERKKNCFHANIICYWKNRIWNFEILFDLRLKIVQEFLCELITNWWSVTEIGEETFDDGQYAHLVSSCTGIFCTCHGVKRDLSQDAPNNRVS